MVKAAAAAGMSYGQYVQATEPRREPAKKGQEAPAERDAAEPIRGVDRVRHSAEFKAEAVKLATSGECSIAEAARRMNIGKATLYEWVKLDRIRRC